jgi:hypothetical protein
MRRQVRRGRSRTISVRRGRARARRQARRSAWVRRPGGPGGRARAAPPRARARRCHHAGPRSPSSEKQAVPGARWLDAGADLLQRAQRALPGGGDRDRVGASSSSAGQRASASRAPCRCARRRPGRLRRPRRSEWSWSGGRLRDAVQRFLQRRQSLQSARNEGSGGSRPCERMFAWSGAVRKRAFSAS